MATLERRIVIDTFSFFKVISIIAFLAFVYLIRDVVALVFAALFLATLIRPAVLILEQNKIPKGVTVIIIYILLIGFAVLSIGLVLPVLLEQGTHLLQSTGVGWQKLSGGIDTLKDFTVRVGMSDNFQSGLRSLEGQLSGFTQGIVATVGGVISGFIALAVVLVMAFYMVVQEEDARRAFHVFVPETYQDLISTILAQVQEKMGWWLLGQLALCVIIGFLYFIGLTVLGYESALVLALFGGFTEFVPYLGPILGGIPIIIVGAASGSWVTVLLGVAMLVLIQQLENHIIVPKVMQKAVGLNPLVSIVALLVGARLFGVIGALLSIPVTTTIGVVLSELYRSHFVKDNVPS
ncbi:AI-2E family transporter [Candidatus Uhrbacteria bacterium]|nr:AI-2E family transporter [Candidatus Uhrbacteria bacterium]